MAEISNEAPLERIIVVEDNEDDRFMIEYMVTSVFSRYKVDAFDIGAKALDSFEEHGASCIILDYRLETEDGITLLADFKRCDPFISVIVLTGQGSEEIASLAIKSGASDYLVKDNINENVLRAAIHNAVTQSELERKIATQSEEQNIFLEILGHDLKAPMQNIQNLSGIATEELAAGNLDEVKRCLSLQADVAKRANELIHTLEKYTRLDKQFAFAAVSLSSIVQSAIDNLGKVILDSNGKIIVGDLPVVGGNAPLLIQLLQNLLHNGLKYNHSQNPTLEVKACTDDAEHVVMTISDNGIGVPQKDLSQIFKPFERLWAYSQYEGSGLGLAICSKIVKLHGGRIWCTSDEAAGSEFHVSIPVEQSKT